MTKANEPAYPVVKTDLEDVGVYGHTKNNTHSTGGPTMREKLAMEIYARYITDGKQRFTDQGLTIAAEQSLRAADIFFDELNK